MKYTYETTYEDESPDGTVLVSAEVRFTYTVTWGCSARIRYDEHDHPAEGDELEIVSTEVEGVVSWNPKKYGWVATTPGEHQTLCSWVDSSILTELMLEDAREQEAATKDAAKEHAAECKEDLRQIFGED